MKKIITTAAVATALLVAGTSASFAATTKPIAKPSKAAEGTKAHEASESKTTEKSETATKKAVKAATTATKKATK